MWCSQRTGKKERELGRKKGNSGSSFSRNQEKSTRPESYPPRSGKRCAASDGCPVGGLAGWSLLRIHKKEGFGGREGRVGYPVRSLVLESCLRGSERSLKGSLGHSLAVPPQKAVEPMQPFGKEQKWGKKQESLRI